MMSIGNIMFEDGEDFVCVDNIEVIPINNKGASFLFFYSILLLLFSFMMWCVFFKIPDYHGLVYKMRSNSVHIEARDTALINSVSDVVVNEIKSIN